MHEYRVRVTVVRASGRRVKMRDIILAENLPDAKKAARIHAEMRFPGARVVAVDAEKTREGRLIFRP